MLVRSAIACLALALTAWAADLPHIKVVLVGDSTVHDGGGWGPGFRSAFGPALEVVNLARNGRSSKSFRDEGSWAPVLTSKADYVLIQFGHNDCPGKGPDRETDPATTFHQNLVRYVDEARAAGAQPILVTSIVRRVFTEDRKQFKPDALAAYAEETRKVAAEKRVPLIDLYERTREQTERAGPDGAAELGARLADGKLDTTHLGPKGQAQIGAIAAQEFLRVAPSLAAYQVVTPREPVHVVVASDGTGDFKTIMNAIDHAPYTQGRQRLIIELRPGTYRERVMVPPDRPRVTLLGHTAEDTIITYDLSAKAAGGTFFSASVEVHGDEFEAENLTFANTFGTGSQAVALSIHSDRAVIRKCRFKGWQDTLYAAWGRQYYRDCFIEGHVDFIFGNAAAVFDNCVIHSKGPGYITAQSRVIDGGPTGFVFRNCKLTGADTGAGVFLGRPWRTYSRVVYLNTEMGDHIRPEGWDNWRNPENEKTAWYGEYQSTGSGAKPAQRVGWSRQLTDGEAAAFAPEVFLKGSDGWNPASGR